MISDREVITSADIDRSYADNEEPIPDEFVILTWKGEVYHKCKWKTSNARDVLATVCGLDCRVNDFHQIDPRYIDHQLYRPCLRCWKEKMLAVGQPAQEGEK